MSKKGPRISIRKRIDAWRQNRNKGAAVARRQTLWTMAKIALVVGLVVGAGASLRYAEVYVKATTSPVEGALTLVDVPAWVHWDLKQRVIEAAGGNRLPITHVCGCSRFRGVHVWSQRSEPGRTTREDNHLGDRSAIRVGIR